MASLNRYYFDISRFDESTKTYEIRDSIDDEVEKIRMEISAPVMRATGVSSKLNCYWVSRANFGYVFADFEKPEELKNIIGVGCKKLFEHIRGDYYCVILSKHLGRNLREVSLTSDRKALIININYFRSFSKIITRENFVDLFLYKFENVEVERLIRTWIIESRERIEPISRQYGVTIPELVDFIEKYRVQSIDDLEQLFRAGTNALQRKIVENYEMYVRELEQFKQLIDTEKDPADKKHSNLENQIKSFIKEHPWVIDFTYDKMNVEERVHDYVDVLLVNSYFGYKKGLLIELKLPGAKTEKPYRTTHAITASVTDALSQIIDYVIEIQEEEKRRLAQETQDTSWQKFFVDAVIIIGKEMTEYLEVLNRYLHNIEIKTYDQIYQDAKRRLDIFARGSAKSVDENPETQDQTPNNV